MRRILLALALTSAAGADTVHLADGTQVEGNLVSLILQDARGQVLQYRPGEVLAYTYGQAAAPAPAPAPAPGPRVFRPGPPLPQQPAPGRPAFQPPGPTPVAGACTPMDCPHPQPGAPGLVVDLRYVSNDHEPGLPLPSDYDDPGAAAEVMAYRSRDKSDRTKWLQLGEARRIHHQKVPLLSAQEELQLYRELSQTGRYTAEQIQEKIEAARLYEHQMRYWFAANINLEPGPWTIYVNFPRRRRHRIWSGLRFDGRNTPIVLRYDWSKHYAFGK